MVGEIYPQAAICVNLIPQCLNVVRPIGPPNEISKIKLNLIPALIHPQRHSADVWFHASNSLQEKKIKDNLNYLFIYYLVGIITFQYALVLGFFLK